MAITWSQPERLVVKAVETLSESAPTDAAAGISLNHVTALTLVLEAEATRTITGGAGCYLRAYFYDPVVGGWSKVPALDINVTTAVAGQRRTTFIISKLNLPERGRIAFHTDTMLVSAGTTVTVYHIAQTRL